MKVTIVTPDQLIIVDGQPVRVSFPMAGEWAVQFNGITAEVEYTDRRPNELISAAEFQARYGHLVQLWEQARAEEEAEQGAPEDEAGGV